HAVEPARHVVADPAERLRGRLPQAPSNGDRDCRRLVVGETGDVGPGTGALDQQRAPLAIAAQQANGAVTVPEGERVRLLVRLVVLRRRHLQHRVASRRRHERVAGERERPSELDLPLRGDLVRDPVQRPEIGTIAHPARPRYPTTRSGLCCRRIGPGFTCGTTRTASLYVPAGTGSAGSATVVGTI